MSDRPKFISAIECRAATDASVEHIVEEILEEYYGEIEEAIEMGLYEVRLRYPDESHIEHEVKTYLIRLGFEIIPVEHSMSVFDLSWERAGDKARESQNV